ncbi:pyruvate kinase [Chlamydiota bacterium]
MYFKEAIYCNKKTKIICTIGPSSRDKKILRRLTISGMNCARLNLSHGNYKDHAVVIKNIREIEKQLTIPIGIILDLQGPRIRIGELTSPMYLEKGKEVILTTEDKKTKDKITITYNNLHNDIKVGEEIFLCEGRIKLRVSKVIERDVYCRVKRGGIVLSHKSVNLPFTALSIPSLTEKDENDLQFGIKSGVDFIAASFVRSSHDIITIREKLRQKNAHIHIIAKIEKPEAIVDIDAIIEYSDAIMIARGDLGVELPLSQVPIIQKNIIKKCIKAGKPVIVATQMLESMVENAFPTRAEAADVANALMDGTSAVMLSEETAVGKNPVEAVMVMSKILIEVESTISLKKNGKHGNSNGYVIDSAIAHASVTMAEDMKVKAIVPFTLKGRTVMLISKFRPKPLIVALTPSSTTYHKMTLYWNVFPVLTYEAKNLEDMFAMAEKEIKNMSIIRSGEVFVIVAGIPVGVPGITNLIKLRQLN